MKTDMSLIKLLAEEIVRNVVPLLFEHLSYPVRDRNLFEVLALDVRVLHEDLHREDELTDEGEIPICFRDAGRWKRR